MTFTTLKIICLIIITCLFLTSIVLLILTLKMKTKIKNEEMKISKEMDYTLDIGVYNFEWESECLN